MKILAIERPIPGVNESAMKPWLKAEASRAWQLYEGGALREAYFREDRAEAVLVLECKDAREAQQLLATLPLVKQGYITFEVIPLRPYPGFARLFAE